MPSHWESVRSKWTINHTPYTESTNPEHPYPIDQYDSIYSSLVAGKTLKKPLQLSFVVEILIHGWKSEGLFTPPPDYIQGEIS